MSAYSGNSLKSLEILSMDLTYLDVHDHSSLGDGTINICADNSGNGFLYSKEKISNAIWTKGTNLKTFIAYNCNITCIYNECLLYK